MKDEGHESDKRETRETRDMRATTEFDCIDVFYGLAHTL